VTVTFEEAGIYQVICDIDDHLSRGQQARFEVTEG
jgi:plastocyanin